MYKLTSELIFPNPTEATSDGLLAIGGDLSAARLLLAYNSGIFPWFGRNQPILWWSPDPRMVLFPDKFRVSKSLRKTLRSEKFKITFNKDFERVISYCANVPRNGEVGTWITLEMQRAYIALHTLRHAVSVEVWLNNHLVGGLYGINLPDKKVFCGESMFSLVNDASKVAFYHLCQYLQTLDYKLIDCQIYNTHLESLGAFEIPRNEFLDYLCT
ncbi:leucyl/phenylalanyl-tRNA--protein transferase [Aequorivita viscosa]|uniref:Leucyl/phenylalanyl-tRNA--protein transferase n=1 Tax=Aequorivita viscosa TaxID=797419 RepID=A0A1M6L982_9FLAO|nr:leucyl/phenylalanyl-tRNA--protein transferase [Aequorivita viscosa]SHJ67659.1 leucyl/phenylalanyl-tRNA--protein transferase [Aequorivita viscosa]